MMSPQAKIAVLVSVGRNPASGTPRAARNDVLALDAARALAPEVSVLHAGDAASALHDYLAYGAASVEVLPLPPGADALAPLAQRLAGYDLILCGQRAEAGQGSGMLPYRLAKALNMPVVSAALELTLLGDVAEIVQFLPKGQRRVVRVSLPAVIALHPLAPRAPRYVFANRRAGRLLSAPALAAAPSPASPWQSQPAVKKPQKLKPPETRQGHARLLGAIATESKGGALMREGSAAEKARAILDYLRANRLIGF
jgi:electron transfer flavoprotein beta subunit